MGISKRLSSSLLLVLLLVVGCSARGDRGSSDVIVIGVINGSEESNAVSLLWRNLLVGAGYSAVLTYIEYGDVQTELSSQSIDVSLYNGTPYLSLDSDDLSDAGLDLLGSWTHSAGWVLAVPDSAEIGSISELTKIVGSTKSILVGEPYLGSADSVVSGLQASYGLAPSQFDLASTAAVAVEADTPGGTSPHAAYLLPSPHWILGVYGLKVLDDDASGLPSELPVTMVAREGFAEEYPEVSNWLSEFSMPDALLYDLLDLLTRSDFSQLDSAVESWMSAHPEWTSELVGSGASGT